MATEVIMPALGMAQDSGKLIEWLKEEGERIEKGEPLMEVETDKATVEVEAIATGVLANVTAKSGDEIPVGHVIALILADGETAPKRSEEILSSQSNTTVAVRSSQQQSSPPQSQPSENVSSQKILASPKVKHFAKEKGIDLSSIKGSGPNGAILMEDVLGETSTSKTEGTTLTMSNGWRVMADRLTTSWTSTPHFNLVRHIDASNLIAYKEQVQEKYTEKLTHTDLLIKLVATALKEHPRVNASWIDNKIIKNLEINIGIAVAVKEGLIVPVIHKADELSLDDITIQREILITRSQTGKLRLKDLEAGTFTISNLGMYDVDSFNAIINPPQAAILAVGRITNQVVPVDGLPAVKPMLTINLSFDHRVVDGASGARFLQTLAKLIEDLPQSG